MNIGDWEVVGSSDVDGLNDGKSVDVGTSETDGDSDCKGRNRTSNNIVSLNPEKPPPEISSPLEEIVYVPAKPCPYKEHSTILYFPFVKHKVLS